MKESLIRRWAHAPWHSWIKDEPRWCDLIAELLARLPDSALKRLIYSGRPLIMLPPVHQGRITRIEQPLLAGAYLLQLDHQLLERPRDEALGILAHELAHVCVGREVHDDALKNDLEADAVAVSWGFGRELSQALRADLESGHPRLVAATRSLA